MKFIQFSRNILIKFCVVLKKEETLLLGIVVFMKSKGALKEPSHRKLWGIHL